MKQLLSGPKTAWGGLKFLIQTRTGITWFAWSAAVTLTSAALTRLPFTKRTNPRRTFNILAAQELHPAPKTANHWPVLYRRVGQCVCIARSLGTTANAAHTVTSHEKRSAIKNQQIMAPRQIRVAGTGQNLPNFPGTYIGTFQMNGGALVFHVFES